MRDTAYLAPWGSVRNPTVNYLNCSISSLKSRASRRCISTGQQGCRYCSAHQNKSAVQLKSRTHGGSLLRGIKTCTYVVIAFTLGRHCACALHHGTTLAEVLLNRVADGISRPYHPDAWRVSLSRWNSFTRICATAGCVPPRESRHRSHPRPPTLARACAVARAFNRPH